MRLSRRRDSEKHLPGPEGASPPSRAWADVVMITLEVLTLAIGFVLAMAARSGWPLPRPVRVRPSALRFVAVLVALLGLALERWRTRVSAGADGVLRDTVAFMRELAERQVRAILNEPGSHRVALLGIMAVAVGVRAYYLTQPIRFDEAVTLLHFAAGPWLAVVSDYSTPNNHILHTLLVKASTGIFGTSLWALRLPAFLAGLVVVPLTYLLIRDLFNASAGLLAAAFTAVSYPLILYSTNARGYTLVTVLFLALLLVGERQMERPRPGGWVVFAALAALGAWTNPTMLYPLGIVVLWLLLSGLFGDATTTPRPLIHGLVDAGLAAALLTGCLYLPVVLRSGLASVTANRWVSPGSFSQMGKDLATTMVRARWSWTPGLPYAVQALLAAGIALALITRRPLSKRHVLLAGAAVVWCTVLLLLTRRAPFRRVWLFLVPIFLGFAAAGLQKAWRTVRPRAATRRAAAYALFCLALAGAGSWATIRSGAMVRDPITGILPDGAQVATFLEPRLHRGDFVVADIPATMPLVYYFQRLRMPGDRVGRRPPWQHRSLYLVVDYATGQTLGRVLPRVGLFARDSTHFRLLRRSTYSGLYECSRAVECPRRRTPGGALITRGR